MRILKLLVGFVVVLVGLNWLGGVISPSSPSDAPLRVPTEDGRSDLERAFGDAIVTELLSVVDGDFVVVGFESRADVSFVEYQMIEMLCAGREFTDKAIQFSAFVPDGEGGRVNGLTVLLSAGMVEAFDCEVRGQIALEPIAEGYDISPVLR